MRDEKVVLPVSHAIDDAYGFLDVCLSMPVIVGADGIEDRVHVPLSAHEKEQLQKSVAVLQETFAAIQS